MIVILIIGILFGLITWWRLQWGVILTLLALPSYLFRFTVLGVPMTVLELFLLIVILRWLAIVLRDRQLQTIRFPWKTPILLFLLAATIAVFVSPEMRAAFGQWKAFIVEPILFYLVLVNVMRTEEDQKNMLMVLGFLTIWIGAIATLQYVGFFPSPEPWVSETPRRVVAIMEYPNAVGLLVAPILGMFLPFLTIARRRVSFPLVMTVLAAGLLALFFTFSRGAWLGLAATLVLLAFTSQYRAKIFGVLAIFVVLLALWAPSWNLALSIVTARDTSTDVRLVLWQGTWNLLKDRPILGAGLAGFPTVYDEYRLAKHTELLSYPHNIFFNFWTETGLLGLIAILILFDRAIAAGARTLHYADYAAWPTQLALAGLGGLTTLVVYGFVDVSFFKNDLAVLFWTIIAFLFWARQTAKNQV